MITKEGKIKPEGFIIIAKQKWDIVTIDDLFEAIEFQLYLIEKCPKAFADYAKDSNYAMEHVIKWIEQAENSDMMSNRGLGAG